MQEKLFFEDSKGNKICGMLSNPTADKNKPIIILCHGFSSSKDSSTYTRLEKILNAKGISTFRFDFYGHGESEGKFEDITISEAVDDILNAIKSLKQFDYKKIGLVGSSFGGMASIVAVSKTNDIYILALKSPVSDYLGKLIAQDTGRKLETWKEEGFVYYTNGKQGKLKLNYSFVEDAKKVNGYEAAKKIKIPTLIVHGAKDETVPIEQSKRLKSLIEDCRLEVIKDADHDYSRPEDFEKMLSLISGFIIENS